MGCRRSKPTHERKMKRKIIRVIPAELILFG
jgi:hypothetical protein